VGVTVHPINKKKEGGTEMRTLPVRETLFRAQIAGMIIRECAKRGITTFDEGMCERIARGFLCGKVVYGAQGAQWRTAIKPLIKSNFEQKVAQALEEIRKKSLEPPEPPVEPEESKLGTKALI
jgi:hypothetical protein